MNRKIVVQLMVRVSSGHQNIHHDDTQNKDTQHNDNQYKGILCDTQPK
jgi:hypothetical protein